MFIEDLSLTITPASALYTNLVPDADLVVNESEAQGRHAIILDFNDSAGLYVRDLGTIFSWPSNAGTVLDVWQPSITPLDDDIYDRLSFHHVMKDLGIVGWGHMREMNLAFSSTTDLTLLLTFDNEAVPQAIQLTIPNSGGLRTKTKVTIPPNKFKMAEVFLYSSQPFKFRSTYMEMKIKAWGSNGPYRIVKPVSG